MPVSIYCVWDQLIFFLQRFLSGKTNNHNWHFEPELRIKIPFWNLWNLVCVCVCVCVCEREREREREGRKKKNRQRKPNTRHTITLKMQDGFCFAKIKIPLVQNISLSRGKLKSNDITVKQKPWLEVEVFKKPGQQWAEWAEWLCTNDGDLGMLID